MTDKTDKPYWREVNGMTISQDYIMNPEEYAVRLPFGRHLHGFKTPEEAIESGSLFLSSLKDKIRSDISKLNEEERKTFQNVINIILDNWNPNHESACEIVTEIQSAVQKEMPPSSYYIFLDLASGRIMAQVKSPELPDPKPVDAWANKVEKDSWMYTIVNLSDIYSSVDIEDDAVVLDNLVEKSKAEFDEKFAKGKLKFKFYFLSDNLQDAILDLLDYTGIGYDINDLRHTPRLASIYGIGWMKRADWMLTPEDIRGFIISE